MSEFRTFSGGRLVIASHNEGKVQEIAALLAPFGADVVSAASLNLPEPAETADSFIGNAELKAQAAALAAGIPALADDSGLAVEALGGAPGIYSARWAGPSKDFAKAMTRVEESLKGFENRNAAFICALTLCWPDGHRHSFEGRVEGSIVWPAMGDHGFGYDPIFRPNGYDLTFAEMEPQAKHAMSHRAHAFAKLVAACFKP